MKVALLLLLLLSACKENPMSDIMKSIKHLWMGAQGLAGSKTGFAGVRGADAEKLAKDPAVFVLDVRTPGEYAEGRIERGTLVPVDELANRLAELPADKEKPVLVYCAMGGRSARAATMLAAQGWTTVFNLEGGITGWREEGRPVAK